MTKKSQSSLIMLLVLILIGLIWITGLAPAISDVGRTSVEENEISGLNGFFYTYGLNLVIGICLILSLLALGRFGFG